MKFRKTALVLVTLLFLGLFSFASFVPSKAQGWTLTQLTTSGGMQPAISGDGSKIAFMSDRDGDEEIFVINSDGTGEAQLTFNTAMDFWPSISADGSTIAFMSDRDGDGEIFVIYSDGTGETQLTFNTAWDDWPSISADGSTIAFMSDRDGDFEIFVINSDGTGEAQLTFNTAFDVEPSISGDGGKIAFWSDRDGDGEIFVINSDGTGEAQLTSNTAWDFWPSISGDGNKIAFVSDRDGDEEIFVINSDGTGEAQLTFNTAIDMEPSISYGGSKIAFTSDRDGDAEIFVINSDGTGEAQLTFNTAFELEPSISYGGSKIAFSSDVAGPLNIWLAERPVATALVDPPVIEIPYCHTRAINVCLADFFELTEFGFQIWWYKYAVNLTGYDWKPFPPTWTNVQTEGPFFYENATHKSVSFYIWDMMYIPFTYTGKWPFINLYFHCLAEGVWTPLTFDRGTTYICDTVWFYQFPDLGLADGEIINPVSFWEQKPEATDYAQSGVPDFDQKQDNWNSTTWFFYDLLAMAGSGWGAWGAPPTSPGPTLFATQGDTVDLWLVSADGLQHDFFVDYDGDGAPSPGEPHSPNFTTYIDYQFVVNAPGPLIGPTPFTYACSMPGHNVTEWGTIIINPQRWSWCGPTAVANSLWWWDSHIDGGTNPPPDIEDHFPLVQNYGPWDDHDPQNVMPFIEHLAGLMNTDVYQCGTDVFAMQEGVRLYLEEKGLSNSFYERTWWDCNLTFENLLDEFYKCEDIILLLGVYQQIDPYDPYSFVRVGGHYVTVAGVGYNATTDDWWIKFSDPLIDNAEWMGLNYWPYVPIPHPPHFGDSSVHNNASLVSHDPYKTAPTPDYLYWSNPDIGHFIIENYPWDILLFEGGLADNGPSWGLGPVLELPTLTAVEFAVIFSPEQYDKPAYPDYAPSKMPDFDQRQDAWTNPQTGKWSWCGPVAVANCLWWFDSKFEPGPAPPTYSDVFPLVQSYGPWDDHDPRNVGPFIQHLATLMKTDVGKNGTNVLDMQAGIHAYLEEKGLNETFYERTWHCNFTFADIEYEVEQCEDVILLLGRYEWQDPPGEWVRINGHYVTVSGVNASGVIKFSDPTLDAAEAGLAPGEVLPPGHGHPLGFMQHNDTLFVSHDYYNVIQGSPIAGTHWGIEGYPWYELTDFQPQGDVEPEQGLTGIYFTAVEYAVIISPLKTPERDVAITNVVPSPTTVNQGDDVNVTITVVNEGDYVETFTVTANYDSNIIGTKIVGPLNPKASTTFNITWSTTGVPPATYTISAGASIVPGETDTADNSFTDGTVTVKVHDVAITNVVPSSITVAQGGDVNVTITVVNEGDYVETFTVTAYYNGNTIGSQSVGPLNPKASTTFNITWSTTGVPPATYTISANASIVLGETDIADNSFTDGLVTVNVHDVAVTNVVPSPTTVHSGGDVNVTITVVNEGDYVETFTVTAYYDNNIIGTKSVGPLNPKASITFNITWSTTGVPPATYTISANASIVLGETDIADNSFTDGLVTVNVHDVAVTNVVPSPTTVHSGGDVNVTITVVNEGDYVETFTVTAYYNGNTIGSQSVGPLNPKASTTFNITWSTTGVPLGTYTISANASTVPSETDIADNSFTDGLVTVGVRDVAVTNVVPSPTTVHSGGDVNVTITVVNEGDYVETFTVTAYYDNNIIGTKSVGPLNPKASITFNITWSTTGVPLGTYTISANASIVPSETDIADNSFTDGLVTVGVHDVAVTQVIRCIPKQLLYPTNATILDVHANTWTVCINVTVKNVGDFTESFTVKAYYDGTVIGTKSVTSLAPGASITLDFKWTPPMAIVHFDWVAKKYTSIYTIKAEAVLAGDANPGDNVKVDGKVRVVMTADVNMDGTISGGDLTGLGINWGKKPGDTGYYAMADVNFDAIISGGDLTGVGLYWGNNAPP